MGRAFGGDLTTAELRFLMEREYARTAEDVVWRRTKSGLRMSADEIAELDRAMRERQGAREKTQRWA
jgi:glycerol-3-phosphate dehydrogenase